MMYYNYLYDSPFGRLRIVATTEAIVEIYLREEELPNGIYEETPLILEAWKQLRDYFEGSRIFFDLPLAPAGTVFQKTVWDALLEIPYGERCSYSQIACKIGNPRACRAVGMANNKNPILFVIPCHRVVGASGDLVGYAAGLEVKARLLDLENKK